MIDRSRRPGLASLDDALASGDLEDARSALLGLDVEERKILEAQMGPEALASAYRQARSRRRGPGLGRVVLLPGLMGTDLDSVDASGDSDHVWVNYLRLFQGRMEDLRLSPSGDPPAPPPTIKPKQLYKKVYLPMLMALQARWQTRPLPYDWRIDVDRSAAALAEEIRSWAGGEPVHLVAHSMGGLVARRFIQRFPDLWASMQDPSGTGRGGRLVMMGTPNRGSYAIALALSGDEKTVKTLARLDFQHDRASLLRILNTFVGSYQLLPSPKLHLGGDDHKKLFDVNTWGNLPVHRALLERGKAFMTEMDTVTDAGRLIFVGGYNQETPHRIHVEGPGLFTYESTLEGDGRVPHETALLEGVATFWVVEAHGDLPKNAKVLAGIHDLLQKGTTAALETRRSAVRSVRGSVPYDPRIKEAPDPEVDRLMAQVKPTRRARREVPVEAEMAAARLEALAVEGWLGRPPAAAEVMRGTASMASGQAKGAAGQGPRLRVEVVWGDITKASGDVFAAGLYRGVLPQNAMLALDRLVSGAEEPPLVLTEHARRGLLRGDLGDVEFFPLPDDRLVAVGGMGHAGAFGETQLRLLVRNLAWAVANLPRRRTICTVLIGAGEGNLSVAAAVRAMFFGIGDALVDGRVRSRVELLRIVELDRKRADEILRTVRELKLGNVLGLDVKNTVQRGRGGRTGRPRKASRARVTTPPRAVPARLTFVRTPDAIRASVITRTSTIPERSLRLDTSLVEELVVRMKDPETAAVPRLSALLRRLLLPREFASALPFQPSRDADGDAPLVFEVDRDLARVHWEMLAAELDTTGGKPVGVRKQVARQLRTEYSPPPAPETNPSTAQRALVIGDPGDPARGMNLPGARREALRVAEVLRAKGVAEVACYVGALNDPEQPSLGVPPATRIDVLDRLLEGNWDILHYSGHGDFLPSEPNRAGWVFQDGLLTSRELERMETAPRLVVSNACLSALTSSVSAAGSVVGGSDAQLVATLADEFFRRGVRDYIGTAWEVNDEGAILFAEALYEALLGTAGGAVTIGEAMLRARQALAAREDVFGPLWAAYQHYGDPTASLVDLTAVVPATPRRVRRRRRRRRRR
jgi:pimeloyl-ACP methyl ester carboxylesterase